MKLCQVLVFILHYIVTSGVDVDGLISDMLKFIGHPDAEIRDKLIYKTFGQWSDNGFLSTVQMKHILDTCLSDTHLFYGIGENGTDSVFTRTFSSLLISIAFCVHDENPFLTAEDVRGIKETAFRYIALEKDFRGFVDGKGWAHSMAHIADVLVNIAGCEIDGKWLQDRDGMLEILQAVKTLACNDSCVYVAEEEDRLSEVLIPVVLSKAVSTDELIGWINSFNASDTQWWNGSFPSAFYLHVNRKNFLRSLYFKLVPVDECEEICKSILNTLVKSKE